MVPRFRQSVCSKLVYEGKSKSCDQKHGRLMNTRPALYGVEQLDTIHFRPCDLIFLLIPIYYGVVCSDSMLGDRARPDSPQQPNDTL